MKYKGPQFEEEMNRIITNALHGRRAMETTAL
jgi:hypothetical protein